MSSFVEELWNSIFTPGATPTLLLATNVSFAALQLVLFSLLVMTYSIHFVILSAICGGLWAAINWFVTELHKEQQKEAEEKAKADTIARQTADDSEETEVETVGGKTPSLIQPVSASKEVEVVEQAGELKQRPEASSGSNKSGVSTEDEWEKVSENETEKDK
jgi:hypothetical protein